MQDLTLVSNLLQVIEENAEEKLTDSDIEEMFNKDMNILTVLRDPYNECGMADPLLVQAALKLDLIPAAMYQWVMPLLWQWGGGDPNEWDHVRRDTKTALYCITIRWLRDAVQCAYQAPEPYSSQQLSLHFKWDCTIINTKLVSGAIGCGNTCMVEWCRMNGMGTILHHHFDLAVSAGPRAISMLDYLYSHRCTHDFKWTYLRLDYLTHTMGAQYREIFEWLWRHGFRSNISCVGDAYANGSYALETVAFLSSHREQMVGGDLYDTAIYHQSRLAAAAGNPEIPLMTLRHAVAQIHQEHDLTWIRPEDGNWVYLAALKNRQHTDALLQYLSQPGDNVPPCAWDAHLYHIVVAKLGQHSLEAIRKLRQLGVPWDDRVYSVDNRKQWQEILLYVRSQDDRPHMTRAQVHRMTYHRRLASAKIAWIMKFCPPDE